MLVLFVPDLIKVKEKKQLNRFSLAQNGRHCVEGVMRLIVIVLTFGSQGPCSYVFFFCGSCVVLLGEKFIMPPSRHKYITGLKAKTTCY